LADRPRVLLIGDSIRLGYQPLVAARLGAAVEVSGPPGYCGDSGDVLKRLGDWIAPGTTLVAVNAGLHDLVRLARVGRNRVEIDRYEAISPASSGSSAPWGRRSAALRRSRRTVSTSRRTDMRSSPTPSLRRSPNYSDVSGRHS
jgi:hypothetical protein